jgi:hypothetical protein
MYKTYFRDRRTLAVYVCREKSFPVTGSLPLKAAYREDTVWIDRDFLDKIPDPHKQTTGQSIGVLLVVLMWLVMGAFNIHHLISQGLDATDAVALCTIVAIFGSGWTLRLFGLVHG